MGAILAPGRRTVASALRVMGLGNRPHFQNYHRVLNRASWSSRKVAHALLVLLIGAYAFFGPIIIGIDETLERRRGVKIAAKGIYRDAARSSHSFFVKASGLRWVVMMLLVPIPWAKRVWALPFFTVLAPSERYHQERRTLRVRGMRHKKVTDWARQRIQSRFIGTSLASPANLDLCGRRWLFRTTVALAMYSVIAGGDLRYPFALGRRAV